MKKGMSLILTGVLTLSMATTAFAAPEAIEIKETAKESVVSPQQILSPSLMYGKITAVTENNGVKSVEVTSYSDENEKIIVHVSDKTFVLNAQDGLPMDLDKRINDHVAVYYGPMTTMSIPAQSPAICILGNIAADGKFPNYAKVEAVTKGKDGSIVVTTDGGSRLVTLGKEMPITPHLTKNIVTIEDVQVGSELLLWYDVMALSMPAQANADKAIILRQPVVNADDENNEAVTENTLSVALEACKITVNQKELAGQKPYKNANGDVMVPVRAVAEALGYEVVWMKGSDNVIVKQGAKSATFTLGNNNYGANKMLVKLNSAPQVKNCTTYVPADFFAQALDVQVVVK